MDQTPDDYDPGEFERPSVTVDTIIFTVAEDDLKVLLIQRDEEPFQDRWALPGGFVEMDEGLDDAAVRVLEDETGVTDVYMEQLYTFGEPDRDPRTRVITVSYFALVNHEEVEIDGSEQVRWFSAYDPPELGFDHDEILEYAVKRLRWKLEYTPAAFSFLPDRFTLSDLQHVYETVFRREFDKRNFRRKLKKKGLVEETGEKTTNVSHRPAMLYRAARDEDEIVEIL